MQISTCNLGGTTGDRALVPWGRELFIFGYKNFYRTGACSIAVGIVTLVTGITAGVLMIVSGSRLLKRKSEILI